MSGAVDPGAWRTWPRKGDHIDAPADSPMEPRLAAMWALTCEAYGTDPENPPPLRKDVVRKGFRRSYRSSQ